MNELIRELAGRALDQAVPETWTTLTCEQLVRFQEKFAELIVGECLKCGGNLSKHYIENHPEKEQVLLLASIADYSNEIKKHFGVKE